MSDFDVAISYTSNDETVAEDLYHYLTDKGLKVFFAPQCQEELAGKDKREAFHRIFASTAKHVVLLVSNVYIQKEDPLRESRIAIARKDLSNVAFVKLDREVALPGWDSNNSWLNFKNTEKLVRILIDMWYPNSEFASKADSASVNPDSRTAQRVINARNYFEQNEAETQTFN